MKKLFSLTILMALILMPTDTIRAENLSKKLSGKILLQVELHGEAWYVNPINLNRYYMESGNAAFNVMHYLGVGISSNNFTKLQNDKNLAKKQGGKIFLKVEDRGQAYYVNSDGAFYYLKDGNSAFNGSVAEGD